MMRNERGSLPIVVIISFTLGIAVLILTQLLLSEKLTSKDIAERQLDAFYNKDMIVEMVNNLTIQKMMSKEWEDELTDETFISMNDVVDIEDVINNTLLPIENSKKKIMISDLYTERLDTYCDEVYEDSENPDEDPYFIGYTCARVPADVEFTVTISERDSSDSFRLVFEDIYPLVTRLGDTIVIDKSDMMTDITPF